MANDLFDHADEVAATIAADQAKHARIEALTRAVYAPAGQVTSRRQAFAAATLDALRADVELARVRQERNKQ